jgi:hypothetical protein
VNPAKSELKVGVLRDVGVRADDKLEEAYRRAHAHSGASEALKVLANSIQGVCDLVKEDMDKGRIPHEPLKVAEYANMMIDRCRVMALTASKHQKNQELGAIGAVQALEDMVDMLKRDVDSEIEKVKRFNDAIESGEITVEDGIATTQGASRATGVRPGASIAQQRKAEESASPVGEEDSEE